MTEKRPRLADIFAESAAKEAAERAQKPPEYADWAKDWAISRLPANHPTRKRAVWEQVNPGVPYPEEGQ
jgi:hypothetical protein